MINNPVSSTAACFRPPNLGTRALRPSFEPERPAGPTFAHTSHTPIHPKSRTVSHYLYIYVLYMYMYICIWFSLPKVLETIPFWWLTIVVPSLAAGGVSPGWSHAAMMGKSDFSLSSLHHISARHQPRPRTEACRARIIIVARYSIILWLYCDYIHWK